MHTDLQMVERGIRIIVSLHARHSELHANVRAPFEQELDRVELVVFGGRHQCGFLVKAHLRGVE